MLLVGAGASRWAGLPSWREAVCALAEDLVPRSARAGPGRAGTVRAARAGRAGVARGAAPACRRRTASCAARRGSSRSSARSSTRARIDPARLPLHQRLVRLAPFVPAIYTTNFDDLLERTFAWAGRPCQVVADAEDLRRWQFDEVDGRYVPRFPIYKLHGTLERPALAGDRGVRTSCAAPISPRNPIDLRFCSDVMGREILLVGYGFNDPNMRWIWTKLRDLRVLPVGWFLELGASTDLERATVAMDRMVRVDLNASDPDAPAGAPRLPRGPGGVVRGGARAAGGAPR